MWALSHTQSIQGTGVMEAAQRMAEMLVAHVTSVHTHAPLTHQTALTRHRFKNKIIKNFKMPTAEHSLKQALNQAWGPSKCGPYMTAWLHL